MNKHAKYATVLTIPLLAILVMSIGLGSAYAHKTSVIGDYSVEIGWAEEPPIQGIKNSIELVVTYATEDEKQKAAANSMGSMKMEHDSMEMEHDSMEMEHDSMEMEHDSMEMEHDSMEMEHDSMEMEHDSMEMEHDSMEMEHDSMEMEHDSMEHDSMEMEHDSMEMEHDSMEMEHDSMEMEHDSMEHDSMEMEHQKRGVSGLEDTIQMLVTLGKNTHTITLSETMVEGIYHGEFTPNVSGFPVVNISGMIQDTEINVDMHPEEVESLSILSPLKQMSIGVEPSDVQCKEGLELFMRVHNNSAMCINSELGEEFILRGITSYF